MYPPSSMYSPKTPCTMHMENSKYSDTCNCYDKNEQKCIIHKTFFSLPECSLHVFQVLMHPKTHKMEVFTYRLHPTVRTNPLHFYRMIWSKLNSFSSCLFWWKQLEPTVTFSLKSMGFKMLNCG
uniref:Uncharacterized protein n=1 Tax=Sphaerodactylus townsendi TaxID=933632 RepID=A0ACB8FB64_9SAUR